MNTYKILKINSDGSLDVTFSIDGKKQNISNLPIDDAVQLDIELSRYGTAYEAGLPVTQDVIISADVQALIGKDQEVKDLPPVSTALDANVIADDVSVNVGG